MKRLLLFIICFLLVNALQAQMPYWAWAKGGILYPYQGNTCITTDRNGNEYIAGSLSGNNVVGNDSVSGNGQYMFVAKIDSVGNTIWVRTANNDTNFQGQISEANSVKTDKEGNLYVAGYFYNTIELGADTLVSNGWMDIFIVKYDKNGNVLWAKSAGGPNNDYFRGRALSVDSKGNAYLTGVFSEIISGTNPSPSTMTISFDSLTLTSFGSGDVFMVKYDKDGNVKWAKNAGGVKYDAGLSTTIDQNDNVFFGGVFEDSGYFYNQSLTGNDFFFYAAKCDSNGNLIWINKITNTYDCSIVTDSLGNLYVTGSGINNGFDFGNVTLPPWAFMAKYSSSGSLVWAKNILQTTATMTLLGSNIYCGADFSYKYFAGSDTFSSYGQDDFVVSNFDLNGNEKWAIHEGGNTNDNINDIAVNSNGDIFIIGTYDSDTVKFGNIQLTGFSNYHKLFFAKLSGITGIPVLSSTNSDLQCYPNPSSGILHFQNTKEKYTSIKVFDQLGRLVNEQNIYPNQSSIDLHALPDGIYYAQFLGKGTTQTKKIIIEH